jgi:hypothetical protein
MKNTITKKDFLENVKHEVEILKNLATKKEIAELNFSYLDPNSFSKCIYGQMKGHCRSQRALYLITKACSFLVTRNNESTGSTFSVMKKYIHGPYEKSLMKEFIDEIDEIDEIDYFSALEAYIMLKGSKNKHIIEYLKGETKTLKL